MKILQTYFTYLSKVSSSKYLLHLRQIDVNMVKIIKVDDFWESMLPLLSSGGASSVFKAWFLFYFSVRLGIGGGGRRRCETCTRKQLIIWTRIPFIIVKHTWAPPPPLESWLLGLVPVSCRRNMGTSTIFIKNKRFI